MGITEIQAFGLKFKNPVIAASGTFGFAEEYNDFYDVEILGAVATKGLTLLPKKGNQGLRILETPSGVMNSIGLQNPGIENYIAEESKFLSSKNTIILANVGGDTIEEYVSAVSKLDEANEKKRIFDIIELNISCPNVKCGGMAFGMTVEDAGNITREIRKVTKKPLVVKLSPNAHDIVKVALAVENAGADGISAVNTFNALEIDIYSKKSYFLNTTAGLSGPAIRPIALRMVREISKAVSIPVIGIGGITDYRDAIKFIMAGAKLIEFGTASFLNPTAGLEIVNGIEKYMKENGISNLEEICGII